MKLKTLKEFRFMQYPFTYYMDNSGGTWHTMSDEQKEVVMSCIVTLKQEAINWIKESRKGLKSGKSTQITEASWIDFFNITEGDLK